jgi:hypothetical protein
MNTVITTEQAKQITGGRTPLVPIEYEQAVRALAECTRLDEAKYWDDKSDALAAWAKIYRDKTVEREARALKLHAYRRMGQLAIELRPKKTGGTRSGNGTLAGRIGLPADGPVKCLTELGLSKASGRAATTLARAPKDEVQRLADLPRPPSPVMAVKGRNATAAVRKDTLEQYKGLSYQPTSHDPNWTAFRDALTRLNKVTSSIDARGFARSLTKESDLWRRKALEAIEWLDEFERHLRITPTDEVA